MFVNFLDLRFKNFMSFGAQLNTMSFEQGLNLITGKNGSGKSGGLLDPLSFCLFGKPYRKVKLDKLINRTNKKGLYTECSFIINNDRYKIIRTKRPASIIIEKNEVELNLLSTKKLIQEEINKILGIDHTMFKQVISLAINYNKPYLAMEINEKRDIIESIFNVKIFGDMSRLLKNEMSGNKTKIEFNEQTVKLLEENLFSLTNRVAEQKRVIKNFEKDKKKDLTGVKTKLKVKRAELKQTKEAQESLQQECILHDEKNFEDAIEELKKKEIQCSKTLDIENHEIKKNLSEIVLLEKNDVCPSCKSKITKKHKEEEITRLKTNNKERTELCKKTNLERKKIKVELDVVKTSQSNRNNGLRWIALQTRDIEQIQEQIKDLDKRIETIKNRSLDFVTDSLEGEFEEKEEDFKELFGETTKLRSEYEIGGITQGILSDSGIKAYFFRKLMPILNTKINEYLHKFEMSIKIELNEFLDEKILGIESIGEDLSYWSHSEGEKKRIDISILLSFIDMTKIICNWDCSLLIMDELLEGQVDDDGLEVMISSLTNLINNKNRLCVYVISHRMQESDVFERHYKVSKASGFSKVERLY